jgi:hypothetical protein
VVRPSRRETQCEDHVFALFQYEVDPHPQASQRLDLSDETSAQQLASAVAIRRGHRIEDEVTFVGNQ